jgi:hypothetical protein
MLNVLLLKAPNFLQYFLIENAFPTILVSLHSGLPDGIFSNQKIPLWENFA